MNQLYAKTIIVIPRHPNQIIFFAYMQSIINNVIQDYSYYKETGCYFIGRFAHSMQMDSYCL